MFAIISSGGKQYKVSENTVLTVSKLAGNPGDKISIDANALSGFVIENSANTQKFIDGSVNNPVNLYYQNQLLIILSL